MTTDDRAEDDRTGHAFRVEERSARRCSRVPAESAVEEEGRRDIRVDTTTTLGGGIVIKVASRIVGLRIASHVGCAATAC